MRKKSAIIAFVGLVMIGGILLGSTLQETNAAQKMVIPGWIKNNAEWWSQGYISDEEFAQGIEYMINDKIIDVSENVPNAFAQEDKNGQPFEDIWDAITKLQNDLANIQISDGIPGPPGPQGEQGPPGNSSGEVDLNNIESRLAALENMGTPEFSVRKVWHEDVVAPLGRETIQVFCEPHETLIHGGWSGSVGLKPIETFQTVLKTEVGNDRDSQKITFENTHDVILTGRVHALCATLIP